MSAGRYSNVGTATWVAPDGRVVPYLRRRFPPGPGQLQTRSTYLVREGDRADVVAAAELGDPLLSWLLADANLVGPIHDLNTAGRVIVIPLPPGTGAPARG